MSYKNDLLASPCRCISCPDCGGRGSMWRTLDGKYHVNRCNDMGDLETCDSCWGSGISETCDRCIELEQIDRDEEDARMPDHYT
jgi:hypothetical protein